jgi:carbamate kinase
MTTPWTGPGPLVIGFGGNALLPDASDPAAATRHAEAFASAVRSVAPDDAGIVLVHGNGPQVGAGLLRAEAAAREVTPSTLDELVAETQGSIGYLLARSLDNALPGVEVSTVITQVVVDPRHPAMLSPTKPVGPFYDHATGTDLATERGWDMVEVPGRGLRRVVASPPPEDVVEIGVIAAAAAPGRIVIAGGGGGIPVTRREGRLEGVEAVIDKDRTASLIARRLEARGLLILTDAGHVAIGWGTPDQERIPLMAVRRARELLDAGEFPPGSMGPKVEASADFAETTGRPAMITSVAVLGAALVGDDGTIIARD